MRALGVFALLVAACNGNNAKQDAGGDGKKTDAKTIDAKVFHDAPGPDAFQAVHSVSCTGATISATFTETDGVNAFNPTSASITTGQIAKFVTSSSHNVGTGHLPADSTIADPGLTCGFNSTCCLMFTQAGMYGFHCVPHGFPGTLTVN